MEWLLLGNAAHPNLPPRGRKDVCDYIGIAEGARVRVGGRAESSDWLSRQDTEYTEYTL